MKRLLKRLFPIVTTIIIFFVIFRQIDMQAFLDNLRHVRLGYLAAAGIFFVITIIVSVERWRWILIHQNLPFGMGIRIFLAAGGLNSLTPSKMGDLSKAYFLKEEGVTDLKRAGLSVLLEKLLDLSSLCAVFVVGVFLIDRFDFVIGSLGFFGIVVVIATAFFLSVDHPTNILFTSILNFLTKKPKLARQIKDVQQFVREIKQNRWRFWAIIFVSILLWVLNIIQIYLFFEAMNADVPLRAVFGLVPIAIFVGLLPVTLGGMGTRDAALILLFAPYAPAALMVGIGLLYSTRYWILSLVGLPFLMKYLSLLKGAEE